MIEWNDKCVIHVDLDAFFASVEQLDNPEYRGKPVIVGGKPTDRRAVVSTASYEARKFGVHSAMPTAKAFQLCPQGIYVYPRMKRYQQKSQEVMDIFSNYSPDIRQISVDEAFIDLSGTQRLFGNPSETAMRLKNEVKEKTGLTVSIGLAQNRYIAKIASGLSKPDGFYEVAPGQEENFMLHLPLEKVWGIGTKTLSHLNAVGFKSTKDVHDRSLSLLKSILGNSSGEFLYNAVRGKEVETFSESKSHSISSETTFSFDLTDRYAIGTALMELSYSVMFRLMRHNLASKTVSVKIRYGDFSTVTVQETLDGEIFSAEDLFECAQALFEKKYNENIGGIRLLGVALQNIGPSVHQKEFFNEKSEKKQTVEKSILALQKKNPKIKIKKARLFSDKFPLITLFFIFSMFFSQSKTFCETMNTTEIDGAGAIVFDESVLPPKSNLDRPFEAASLFNYSVDDNNVEFLAQGYWESVLSESVEANFGFGNTTTLSIGSPVFSQKVDLSLWFMLNKSWYFEAAFADGFEKNTVAAGYYGEGLIKEARIANRGITFPSTYSIDSINRGIGGGNNQAPGVFFHFEDDEFNKWKGDFTFRYDMLSSHDKTYFGHSAVSDNSISPEKYLTGQIYVLPDDSSFISDIQDIYVESANGSYTDLQGRKYKKLASSDYMLFPARRQIILSKDAGAETKQGVVPSVAISFSSSSTYSSLQTALGAYGTVSNNVISGNSGFLGKIQEYFGENFDSDDTVKRPMLSKYSYGNLSTTSYQNGSHPTSDKTGTKTDGFFSYIGGTSGTKILFIQHPAGFSPFAAAYRYDGGTVSINDAIVASNTTGTESDLYSVIVSDDATLVTTDFFSDTHTYVDVFNSDDNSTSLNSAINPSVRYPMADSFPGYYLGYETANDLCIRLRTYSANSRFDIGTDAVPGTVRLYKNGVIDNAAKYDAESGSITPSTSVSESDRIYITWYEDSTSNDSGAITAAAGYSRNFTQNLNGDISFSTRWAYNPEKNFADSTSAETGFATIATGLSYKTENFELSNIAAATLESDNVTGNYRILGMNDKSPDTVYLTTNAGVDLPQDFTPSLNARIQEDSFPELKDNYNGSISAETGSKDSEISGYKIPVSWNFSEMKNDSNACAWAATAIDLGNSGANLASGTEFSIALKTDDINLQNYDVYLQLGVDADEDFTVENTTTIPTWKISDANATDVENAFNPSATNFESNIVKIRLTDEDRAKFVNNFDARIIIVVNNSPSGTEINSQNQRGTIWVGPYEIQTQGIFTEQNDDLTVVTPQTTTSGLSGSKKFNTGTNYVQNIEWKNSGNVSSQDVDKLNISMIKYFSEVDLKSYQKINLFFRLIKQSTQEKATEETSTAFTLILDRDASGISTDGKTAVRIEISQKDFKTYTDSSWHELSIDRIKKTVSIDNSEILTNAFFVDSDIVPVRLKMILATVIDGNAITKGEFSIDELNLSGSKEHYIFEDTIKTAYQKPGTIFAVKEFPIISDFSISAEGNSTSTIHKIDKSANDQVASGNSAIKINIATISLAGDIAHVTDSDKIISSAGHKISTTKALLGIFSGTEEFRFNSVSETLDKKNTASINLKKLYLPLEINASTEAIASAWSIAQNSSISSNTNFVKNNFSYTLRTKAFVNQKMLPSAKNVEKLEANTYEQGWNDSTYFSYSTGKENASKRTVGASISNDFLIPFAKLAPNATFSTEGKYSNSSSTLFSDSSKFSFSIPFSINSNTLSFQWTKEAGGIDGIDWGGNYKTDFYELSEKLNDRSYFFNSLPFADMTSKKLADSVLSDTNLTSDSAESLYYSSTYSANWKRPIFGNKNDLFIPASITFSASRNIRTSETISDIYQFKGTLNYTAFNIFGKNGSLLQTQLFDQDEYIASFSTTAKIPRDNGTKKFEFNGYIQGNFYFNNTDSLRTGTEITVETVKTWATKGTLIWKRQGKISPIVALITLFSPDFDTKKTVLTRTDSINVSVSQSESSSTTNSKTVKKQSFELNHSLDIKMTKYLTITSSLAENYNCTWDDIILLSITAGIGMRVQF